MSVPRWLPPLLWAGVIVLATSVPTTLVPRRLAAFDKAIHFGMYAVLSALFTHYLLNGSARLRLVVISAAAVIAFGAADEWHQRFIPGRSTEFADWVADSVGALAGATVISLVAWRQARVRRPA